MAFSMAGYDFVHHGEGRWNGVAIAERRGIGIDGVFTNFGLSGVRDSSAGSSEWGRASATCCPFDPDAFVEALFA